LPRRRGSCAVALRWSGRRTDVSEYAFVGVIVALLLVYLVVALLKPQKF